MFSVSFAPGLVACPWIQLQVVRSVGKAEPLSKSWTRCWLASLAHVPGVRMQPSLLPAGRWLVVLWELGGRGDTALGGALGAGVSEGGAPGAWDRPVLSTFLAYPPSL